jgi:hypothetical protein
MTLVLCANYPGLFSIMTSDTRRCSVVYGDNYEIDHSQTIAIPDVRDVKTHKLNDYLLVGAGGTADLAVYLADILKREVMEHHDITDAKRILECVIAQERTNREGPEFLQMLNVPEGVTVIISGFSRDGRTGIIVFDPCADEEFREYIVDDCIQMNAITPAKGYLRNAEALFTIPGIEEQLKNTPIEELTNVLFKTVFNHLEMLHGVISYQHPVEISPDFEAHIITMSKGVPKYDKLERDVSESHKQYAELAKRAQ